MGLTDEQVRNIEQQTDPTDKLTIYSPLSGVVIHKNAREGMYVNTGTAIYTIADLKQVWIILDAYESDISLLKHGQEVTLTVEALPGQTFTGNIAFIDPVMDDRTRTVKIRLNISNSICAPTWAVLVVASYCGATSTTSPPTTFRPAILRIII